MKCSERPGHDITEGLNNKICFYDMNCVPDWTALFNIKQLPCGQRILPGKQDLSRILWPVSLSALHHRLKNPSTGSTLSRDGLHSMNSRKASSRSFSLPPSSILEKSKSFCTHSLTFSSPPPYSKTKIFFTLRLGPNLCVPYNFCVSVAMRLAPWRNLLHHRTLVLTETPF